MFGSDALSCILCRVAFVPSKEIIIYYGLVAELDGMAFGGHIGIIVLAYQPRYVI